jgi:hypothetical protein
VTVERLVPVMLPPGAHTLRIKVDSLDTAVELSELNNAVTAPMTVVQGVLDADDALPARIMLSSAQPNPADGPVTLSLALPRAGRVALTVFDVAGRSVWRTPPRLYEAGRWSLTWDGTTGGRLAPPGLYLARVEIARPTPDGEKPEAPEHVLVRRVSMMR